MKLFTDDCEYVVAEDEADATAAWAEFSGDGSMRDPGLEWSPVRDNVKLSAWVSEASGSPVEPHSDGSVLLELTAAEWVARSGRGWLFAMEY